MIEVREDAMVFNFPEIHHEARCTVIFQRTLRVPQDGGRYPVPPGLGRFHLSRVDGLQGKAPEKWDGREGVFFPMYQGEAAWIIFVGWYPFAVKVEAGNINAVTGRRLHDDRLWRPQDYVVVPQKPWMEWFCVGNGQTRQFVAHPLCGGQDGDDGSPGCHGERGIRIAAHPMRAERYRSYRRKKAEFISLGAGLNNPDDEMGSSPGWLFHRDAWREDFGHGAWELSSRSQVSVYPVNSLSYREVTGCRPPGKPPSEALYSEAGIPWMKEYGSDREVLGKEAAFC